MNGGMRFGHRHYRAAFEATRPRGHEARGTRHEALGTRHEAMGSDLARHSDKAILVTGSLSSA